MTAAVERGPTSGADRPSGRGAIIMPPLVALVIGVNAAIENYRDQIALRLTESRHRSP
jgi:hypothetical protein